MYDKADLVKHGYYVLLNYGPEHIKIEIGENFQDDDLKLVKIEKVGDEIWYYENDVLVHKSAQSQCDKIEDIKDGIVNFFIKKCGINFLFIEKEGIINGFTYTT